MNALQNTTGRKGTSWGRRLQAIARRTSWNLHSLFSRDRPSKRSTRLVCEQLESREVPSPVPGSAIYSHDGRHRAWIDQDKVGQRVFSADIIKGADRNIQIGRYFYQIYDLSYSPNSSNLAFFGRDGAGNNYRWSNWVRYGSYGSFQMLGGYHGSMSYLTWSPDSRHVFAITGNDRPGYSDIMLDGRMMIGGWGARGNIGIPKFSPDGNHLFFTNYWRESNGQMITNTWKDGVYLRQYWGNINSVQFSPDSRHLGYTFTDRGHEGFWEDGRTFTCQKVRNFAYSSNSLYFSVDAFDGKQWRPLTFKA